METMTLTGATGMTGDVLCLRSARPLELRRRDRRNGIAGAVVLAAAAAVDGIATHPVIDGAFPHCEDTRLTA